MPQRAEVGSLLSADPGESDQGSGVKAISIPACGSKRRLARKPFDLGARAA